MRPDWIEENDIICETCGLLVAPLDDMRRGRWCRCDRVQQMRDLESFGYVPAGEARSFGGEWALRRRDGSVVYERAFGREIERLLKM